MNDASKDEEEAAFWIHLEDAEREWTESLWSGSKEEYE